MFMFKKFFAPLFFPLPLCLGILLVGLFFLWGTRRQRAGKIMVTIGTGLLALLSFYPVPEMLLRPLEQWYPPLASVDAWRSLHSDANPIKWIVVLDGDEGVSLARALEGVRLYKQLPGVKLLLSGGSVFGSEAGAVAMARIDQIMGVDPHDIVLEAESQDTEDEARRVKKLVANDRFILVTSASHLPRAVALFRKQGLNPIPAPVGYQVVAHLAFSPGSIFPQTCNLRMAETAFYEYLGLAWAWLRGAL